MDKLNALDIFVIIIYSILCLVVAYKYLGKIKNIRDYALGGTFSNRVLAATLFATFTGAGRILGYVERIHEIGLIFALAILFEPIAWIVTAKLFSRNIEYFRQKGCMSISDIMYVLYGNWGKWVSNILSIVLSIGILAIQIKAIGYLSEYFFGLAEYHGAAIGFAVVVIYSMFGGIRAVVFTDVLQSLVFLVGVPAACFSAYYSIGGYTGLIEHIPQTHRVVEFNNDNILLLVSCVFFSLIPLTEIPFVQRFLMAKNASQFKNSLYYAFLPTVPFYLVIILTGFVTLATLPDGASKLAFYELVTNNLPEGIKGLVVVGLLAAIMSSADSYLNSAGVMFAHNVMRSLFPKISQKTELKIAKLATLLFSLLSLSMAFTGDGLAKIMRLSENFWIPFIVMPLIAGFFKFYTNSTSFKGSLICAFIFVIFGRLIAGEFGVVTSVFGLVGSSVGLFGFHRLQGMNVQNKPNVRSSRYRITLKGFRFLIPSKFMMLLQRDILGKTHVYYYFGIFGMLFFLFSSLAFHFTDPHIQMMVMWLRVSALLICTLLCMNELIQSKSFQQKWMPILWNAALIYCLPFLSVFTLLVSDMEIAWIANLIISFVLLALLTNGIITIYSTLSGSILAYIFFKISGSYTSAHLDNNYTNMLIAIYGAGAALIVYMLNKREQEHATAITTKLLYSTLIAHEAKSPITTIYTLVDKVSLIIAGKNNLTEDEMEIARLLPQLKQISRKSICNIERTLNNLRSDISDAEDYGIYKITDCIREVIEEYGLSDKELARIKVNYDRGFRFIGSKHFMKLILVNLISNFFKYAGKRATLEIYVIKRALYVKDNGVGMDDNQKSRLFVPFDKGGSTHGTGVGLAFCDQAMKEMKGSIEVISEKGEGTMFILRFARI